MDFFVISCYIYICKEFYSYMMLYAHFSEHNCFASICLIKHGISSKELLWNLQKKGLEDYFLTGSSSNLNGIHVQFQRPGWKMAPHKEGKSTWGMGKDLDCPRSCCDSHFDFKEMSFFDLKLAIPIRSYHIYHGLAPFLLAIFLGLVARSSWTWASVRPAAQTPPAARRAPSQSMRWRWQRPWRRGMDWVPRTWWVFPWQAMEKVVGKGIVTAIGAFPDEKII